MLCTPRQGKAARKAHRMLLGRHQRNWPETPDFDGMPRSRRWWFAISFRNVSTRASWVGMLRRVHCELSMFSLFNTAGGCFDYWSVNERTQIACSTLCVVHTKWHLIAIWASFDGQCWSAQPRPLYGRNQALTERCFGMNNVGYVYGKSVKFHTLCALSWILHLVLSTTAIRSISSQRGGMQLKGILLVFCTTLSYL